MTHIVFPAGDLTLGVAKAARQEWDRALDEEPSVGFKSVSICCVGASGEIYGGPSFFALLAKVLAGGKSDGFAVSLVENGEARALRRSEIDWSSVTQDEWLALERAGLSRRVSSALRRGDVDPAREDLTEAQRLARELVALCGDGTYFEISRRAFDVVKEAVFDKALTSAGGNRAHAASILGVSRTRLSECFTAHPWLRKRWPRGPGGSRPGSE